VDAKREESIRWAIEERFGDLAEAQAAGGVPADRGMARVLNVLHEHGATLLSPPPQLFAALELPEEFAQSISVRVPVATTADGDFVITVRVTLMDATSYESWRAAPLSAEPAADPDEFRRLRAATAELLEASRVRREAEAAATPPLAGAPAPAPDPDETAAVRRAAEVLADGDEHVLAVLLDHLAPSVRLHPAEAATSRSRFGGVPFLPASLAWPRRGSGRPLHFLAQIDLRELPRTPLTAALPADGMLAFFYDAERMPWGIERSDADGFAVLFVAPGSELEPVIPPADTANDFVRPAAGIRFELEATVDPYELPLDEMQQDAIDERCAYDAAHRLLGVADAIQGDPRDNVLDDARADEWRLLLQVDSGEPLDFEFEDSGRIYFLIRSVDLAAHRWDRCWLVLQCY
jgi:uncharacterized protein YwqG